MITLYHGSNVSIDTIDLATLVEELTYRHLNRQYFFGTSRAIQTLKRL